MRFARRASLVAATFAVACTAATAQTTPPDGIIATGVTIDGVAVGGMTESQARLALIEQRIKPRFASVRIILRARKIDVKPTALGYSIRLQPMIDAAMRYGRTVPISGPVDVPLNHSVARAKLVQTLRRGERVLMVRPRNAILSWRGYAPRVWPAKLGYAIRYQYAIPRIETFLLERPSRVVRIPARALRPAKRRIGVILVVNRATRTLTMYSDERRIRRFSVAVGTSTYPTPRGLFRVVSKQTNPTWFPPNSPWAKGLGPIPPGPGNPLGTRWIGTSASGIGIHGTYASWTVGTAASHGCLRMRIPEVEWLYNYVRIGTVVRIV